ncbi:MAG: hypothetical protein LBS88_13260 [Tannerellaceae bacterium]|jgi:hypothetical protein|nr:hypothetical protein [Tannerellaceae bacterium]
MSKKVKLLLVATGLIAMHVSAQVGIGTLQPDEATMLDVFSADKGILIPRISLPSTTYALRSGISVQPASLLVYNTGGNLPEGFYFWNGSEWKNIESSTAIAPAVSGLICERASLEPSSFKADVYYSGLMRIPYPGGNGGKYSIGNWVGSTGNTGLKMRLKAGRLEYGAGELVYDVEGTPAFNSPVGATFAIDFGGHRCEATVGEVQNANVTSVASVGPLVATSENGYEGYHRFVTSPDGDFSVRVFIDKGGVLENADLQIRSNTDSVTIIWNGIVSWTTGYKGTGSNAFYLPLAGIWYGNVEENGNSAVSKSTAGWGDEDVYYGAPEQRRYVWSTPHASDKAVYVMTFMMGAPNPKLAANPENALQTKAFLRIEQIDTD